MQGILVAQSFGLGGIQDQSVIPCGRISNCFFFLFFLSDVNKLFSLTFQFKIK